MGDVWTFTGGSEVAGSDERLGSLKRVIVDASTRAITHIGVESHLGPAFGRLVPIELVQSADGNVVRLLLSKDSYRDLPHGAEIRIIAGADYDPHGAPLVAVAVHHVPQGALEVEDDANVVAIDGPAGHLVGFVANPDDHVVQHLLVRIGHFSGHRQVAIPFSVVSGVGAGGIKLDLSRTQLSQLNPA